MPDGRAGGRAAGRPGGRADIRVRWRRSRYRPAHQPSPLIISPSLLKVASGAARLVRAARAVRAGLHWFMIVANPDGPGLWVLHFGQLCTCILVPDDHNYNVM